MRSESTMMRRGFLQTALITSALTLAVACDATSPAVQANLRLSLAQVSGASYAEAVATQGDTTVKAVLDENNEATLRIVAGLETRLSATVFRLQPQVWDDFEGAHSFEPVPGINDVSLELAAIELRDVTISPVFEGSSAVAFQGSLPIVVRDEVTGFESPDLFTTATGLRLPKGRTFKLWVTWPGATGTSEVPIAGDAAAVVEQPVVGMLPSLPIPTAPIMAGGTTIDLSGFQDPVFAVVCAIGDTCSDALEWVDCSAEFDISSALPANTEGAATVQIRFRDIPGVTCTEIRVISDHTPPTPRITFAPAYLTPSSTPGQVDLSVLSGEELALQSLTVTATGSGTPARTFTCGAFDVGTSPMLGVFLYVCPLDLTSWTQTDRSVRTTVTGTDSAGNAFTVDSALVYVSSPSSLAVIGARFVPPLLDVLTPTALLAVDVVNLNTTSPVCNVFLDDQMSPPIFTSPVGVFYPPSMYAGSSYELAYLPPMNGSQPPAPRTVYFTVQTGSEGPNMAGTYTLKAGWALRGTDCAASAVGPVAFGQPTTYTMSEQPMRPISSGRVLLGIPTDSLGSFDIFAERFISNAPLSGFGCPPNWTSSNPEVIEVTETPDPYGCVSLSKLKGKGPGVTRLRASVPTEPERGAVVVEVELVPSTALVVAQQSQVTTVGSGVTQAAPIDATINTKDGGDGILTLPPVRVLWDSTRDAVVVVTTAGVERRDAAGARALLSPCGTSTTVQILDAALTAAGPVHDRLRPDLLLLTLADGVTYGQCLVRLDELTTVTPIPLPPSITDICSKPSRLSVDPVTGRAALVGLFSSMVAGDMPCAVSYSFNGPLVERVVGNNAPVSPYSPMGGPTTAALDAGDGTLATSFPTDGSTALGAFSLGQTATAGALLDVGAPSFGTTMVSGLGVSALAVDPRRHGILAAGFGNDIYTGATFTWLTWYADRQIAGSGGRVVAAKWPNAGKSGFMFTHLVVDAASNRAYAIDDWVTKGAWVIDLSQADYDFYNPFTTARTLPLSAPQVVADVTLAGPQPFGIEPRRAAAGSTVVVHGVGFAGEGRDVVVLDGIPVPVVSSTPTTVTFRVPSALAPPPWGSGTAMSLAVLSNGRLSGELGYALTIDPARPSFVLPSYRATSVFSACAASCTLTPMDLKTYTAVSYQDGTIDAGVADIGGSINLFGPEVMLATGVAGGDRAVGIFTGTFRSINPNWRTYDAPRYFAATGISFPEMPLSQATTSAVTAIADDPQGRYLAYSTSSQVALLWANGLAEPPASRQLPATGIVAPARFLAFTPDGLGLVAADTAGRVDGVEVDSKQVSANLTRQGCPTGRLFGLWPTPLENGVLGIIASTTGASTAAVLEIQLNGSSWTATCSATAPEPDSAILKAAALAPSGDALLFVETAGGRDRLRLVTTALEETDRWAAADTINWTDAIFLLGSEGAGGDPQLFMSGIDSAGSTTTILSTSVGITR
jgi:hypothetical protein